MPPVRYKTEAGINLMGKRQLGFEFISEAGRKLLFFSPPTLMRRLKRFLLNVASFNSMLSQLDYKKNSKSLIVFVSFPEIYSLFSIYKAIIKPELQVYGYFECSTSCMLMLSQFVCFCCQMLSLLHNHVCFNSESKQAPHFSFICT